MRHNNAVRSTMMAIAVSFIVLNALNYLLFSYETSLPTWAILALVGLLVMSAGTSILLGRERWPEIQRSIQDWWECRPNREPRRRGLRLGWQDVDCIRRR